MKYGNNYTELENTGHIYINTETDINTTHKTSNNGNILTISTNNLEQQTHKKNPKELNDKDNQVLPLRHQIFQVKYSTRIPKNQLNRNQNTYHTRIITMGSIGNIDTRWGRLYIKITSKSKMSHNRKSVMKFSYWNGFILDKRPV